MSSMYSTIVGYDWYGRPITVPVFSNGGYLGNTTDQGYLAYSEQNTNAENINSAGQSLQSLANLHNTLLVNGQLVSTGTGDGQSAVQPTTTIKKPWLDAQDGSTPYDEGGAVALPVVGGPTTVVVTHIVPTGYDGNITAYSVNFTGGGFVDGSGDLQFQILRNGIPIKNYQNILTERGTTEIPRPCPPIRTWSNDIIQIVVNHIANNLLAGNVVGSLVGWDYPSAS